MTARTTDTSPNSWEPGSQLLAGVLALGAAKGQGLTSFGGTWYAPNGPGTPVTTSSPSGNASSDGGYGYCEPIGWPAIPNAIPHPNR